VFFVHAVYCGGLTKPHSPQLSLSTIQHRESQHKLLKFEIARVFKMTSAGHCMLYAKTDAKILGFDSKAIVLVSIK